MRTALKITAVLMLLAVPPIASAAAGSGRTLAINCNQEQFKPRKIVLACGDGGSWLGKLKWSSWSRSTAAASGTYNAIDCTPTCAAGHVKTYPVRVTLSKPKPCPGQAQRAFKRAALSYTGTRPPHAPASLSFLCPPPLPGQY
jgi:hypothetical protein